LSDLLVFGGKCHPNPQQRPAWDLYESAVLLRIRDRRVVDRLEYRGWELDREVGLSVCFRAAAIAGNFAYTCTSTQVLKIDLERFAVVDAYTHRYFNDLHHVVPVDDRFYVAATGIDSVLEFDERFELRHRYPIANDEILALHGPDADYRRIPTTKPHHAHPNYVGSWGGEVWVTNFEAGRAQTLANTRQIPLSENRIHDGVQARGRVWFTAVNGEVITVSEDGRDRRTFNLTPMTRADRLMGWCRGIAATGDDEAVVGFSKLRETKLRENLKWLGNKLLNQSFALSEPTRIACYDLARGVESWRVELEEHDCNAVFSINLL